MSPLTKFQSPTPTAEWEQGWPRNSLRTGFVPQTVEREREGKPAQESENRQCRH